MTIKSSDIKAMETWLTGLSNMMFEINLDDGIMLLEKFLEDYRENSIQGREQNHLDDLLIAHCDALITYFNKCKEDNEKL